MKKPIFLLRSPLLLKFRVIRCSPWSKLWLPHSLLLVPGSKIVIFVQSICSSMTIQELLYKTVNECSVHIQTIERQTNSNSYRQEKISDRKLFFKKEPSDIAKDIHTITLAFLMEKHSSVKDRIHTHNFTFLILRKWDWNWRVQPNLFEHGHHFNFFSEPP